MKKSDIFTTIKNLISDLTDKADKNHTHNYAGSSSAGGSATSAEKLTHTLALKAGNNKQLGTFDGSKSLSIDVGPTAIGAALEGHTHSDYVTQTELNNKLDDLSIQSLTQTEYDALTTKDANTLYLITE